MQGGGDVVGEGGRHPFQRLASPGRQERAQAPRVLPPGFGLAVLPRVFPQAGERLLEGVADQVRHHDRQHCRGHRERSRAPRQDQLRRCCGSRAERGPDPLRVLLRQGLLLSLGLRLRGLLGLLHPLVGSWRQDDRLHHVRGLDRGHALGDMLGHQRQHPGLQMPRFPGGDLPALAQVPGQGLKLSEGSLHRRLGVRGAGARVVRPPAPLGHEPLGRRMGRGERSAAP